MSPFRRAASLAAAWLLLLAASAAHPLASDREQSITIQADSAERDEAKGTTTYAGNVVMQQGSMRIDADKVVIYNTRSKVNKIVATGQPARYQQKPNEAEGIVIAQARTLEYNISQETLHLIENAALQQEGTSLSGNRIDYDVRQSVVKAGSDAKQTERVRMVIPARALKYGGEDEAEPDAAESATEN